MDLYLLCDEEVVTKVVFPYHIVENAISLKHRAAIFGLSRYPDLESCNMFQRSI